MTNISRRSFLRNSALATAAFTVAPSTILGKSHGYTAPSDKLNIAGIGIGGKGESGLRALNSQNIVALCDVDWAYADKVFKTYPNAKKYWDYRKMYDELGKSIDAVIIATPDHTHAIASADAMTLGKHVYTEKPLTHSVYESRLLTNLAAKYKVATQMGNQGASGEGVNLVCEWIWNGEIGEVKKVEAWTNRPVWPQGLDTPTEVQAIPDTLNWDLFLGPAQERAYNRAYTPWNWRGWWDYGTGALGDMACHILHPVFAALKLTYPTLVQGSSTELKRDCAPTAQKVKLTYPARENMPKVAMPEVEVWWYDGGIQPDRPEGYTEAMSGDGGAIFYGTKDTLICDCYGARPRLLSGRVPNAPKVCRRVEGSHEMDWVRACKEKPTDRILTKSDFSQAGPFNEMVVMGVLAVRLQGLNRVLEWDGSNMQFTNISDSDKLRPPGVETIVVEGHPTQRRPEPISAKAFADELIKHNYRKGWNLVAMP